MDIVGQDIHKQLRELLVEMSERNVLLLSDFNYNEINWSSHSTLFPDSDTNEHTLFLDCIDENLYTQHVETPTRGQATLDLIISSEPDLVSNVDVMDSLANSDHNMVACHVHMTTASTTAKRPARDHNKANFDDFRKSLAETDWNKQLTGNIHDSWDAFKAKLEEIDSSIPLKVEKHRRAKPLWLSYSALRAIKKKYQTYAKYRDKTHPAVIRANTLASTAVRKSKQRYEEKLSENIKDDKKSFYAYVRSKSKAKVTLGSLKGKDGQVVTEPKEVAKLFNDYFASVFTPENTTRLPDIPQCPEVSAVNKLSDVNFTIEAVAKALSKV